MQRDFLEPGGFGESLGNDVSMLARVVEPLQALLAAARGAGMLVVHTREGHRPDLADCPPAKLARGGSEVTIGSPGPKGRILVRGEYGPRHHRRARARSRARSLLDKPGKGAFYATDLELLLRNRGITQPHRHRRHDRGVRAHHGARGQRPRLRVPRARRTASARTSREFQEVGLKMIAAQGGIFGWVGTSADVIAALPTPVTT